MNILEKIGKIPLLTGFELVKIFRQRHALVGGGVLALLVGLCSVGISLRMERHAERRFSGRLVNELINGVSFSQTVLLPGIYILLPMMVGILAASLFAGEFESGQIRMMAIRPSGRARILIAKLCAISIYAYICLAFLLGLSLACGALLFGFSGDVLVFGPAFLGKGGSIYIMQGSEAWNRLLLSYFFAGYSLVSIAALFILFSMLFRKLTLAIIIPLGIYFTSYILDAMPFMESLQRYLPTRYLMAWKHVMAPKIEWQALLDDGTMILAYTLSYLAIAALSFKNKDI